MRYTVTSEIPNVKEIKNLYENLNMESKDMEDTDIMISYLQSSISYFLLDENLALCGIIRGCGDSVWSMNIDLLIVKKELWHNGLGTVLLNRFLDGCKSRYITVCTKKENYNFYKKFGFLKIEDGYYQIKR